VARTFFRIVKTTPPTRRDFASNQEKRGDPRPHLPQHLRRLWNGLSIHATEAQSRRQARENPWLGRYIAELQIPDHPLRPMRWERTVPSNEGHYTLWGDADELLNYVTRVVPAEEAADEQDL
jgi:hypothetical protein